MAVAKRNLEEIGESLENMGMNDRPSLLNTEEMPLRWYPTGKPALQYPDGLLEKVSKQKVVIKRVKTTKLFT